MRVLLVGNYAFDRQYSMARFAQMLEAGMRARGHDVSIIRPRPWVFPQVDRRDGPWKWVGYLNKFVLFAPALLRAARGADIVHICDHSNAMYVPWLKGRITIVTTHDVIALRAARGLAGMPPTGWSGRILQRLILRGLCQANRITTVSDLTREEVLELAPALDGRVDCVPNGLGPEFHPIDPLVRAAILRRLGLQEGNYFLHVGTEQPRKNRAQLVHILALLRRRLPQRNFQLALVGGAIGPQMRRLIDSVDLDGHVKALGNVAPEQLRAIYGGAAGLLFPSLYEGFGWPVIEAQACGCPVFASRRRPLTDLGADAALYFDPLDAEDAVATIIDALPTLEERRQASLRNAARFSPDAMVEGHLAAYRAALGASGERVAYA